MIKFKALIHKKTGTVIKYEDWLTGYKKDFVCTMPSKLKAFDTTDITENCTRSTKPKTYFMKDIIFNDDFEIVYDSEFTTEELKTIYCNADAAIDKYPHAKCESEKQLKEKVLDILTVMEIHKNKYGIEV